MDLTAIDISADEARPNSSDIENGDVRQTALRRRKITLRDRLKLLGGGPRRFFLRLLKPNYVEAQLAERQGTCARCGACCQMSWRCPHLFYDPAGACCRLYGGRRRGSWCRDFPIDQRCLADRKLAGFDSPCGYWWPEHQDP